jgi:carbon-monoxide dehydrogenase medium subunit
MKAAAFEYHAPSSAADAVGLLSELGEESKILSGGQSLIPMLALRLAVFAHLVDIGRIPELKGIQRRDGTLWIGATTTEAAIERSSLVSEAIPMLARATPFIGHLQIRNRGTIGGSIAHADSAAEYPAVALALDATMHVLGPAGSRTVPAADFFRSVWTTSLGADELLTGVEFPVWTGRCGFAVHEFARRHGDFAIAGAAVGVAVDQNDAVTRCAIGLFGLGPTPQRAARAETSVLGRVAADVVVEELTAAAVADLASIPSDLHGSATYRRRIGATMVGRAWVDAVAEATERRDG